MRRRTQCPGAITDLFYVISSALQDPPAGSSSCIPLTGSSQSGPTSVSTGSTTISSDGYHNEEVPWSMTCYENDSPDTEPRTIWEGARWKELRIPSVYQPHRGAVYDELLFSHFFDTYGKGVETMRTCSWLSYLPRLLKTTFKSRAMKYASRATCMAWYALLTGDLVIAHTARKVYALALNCQLTEVYGSKNGKRRVYPSEEAICTAIMMAYFEIVTSTTGRAWEQHFAAAASMIEMYGPERCNGRFINQLYRSVRLATVRYLMER